MLTISNIYGHGFDYRQLSKLETVGFRIRPQVSTYMGSQICRFIDFEEGPCLEVIEVEDDKQYLDFVPDGMRPYCPGISLALSRGSGTTIRDFEREFHHLHPYALHVNYDGSTDPKGLGWNYLNFATPIVPDTFIWLTAFDDPRPVREYDTNQPNRVKGITGLVFDLGGESVQKLSQLVKADTGEGVLRIDRVDVWLKSSLGDFPNLHDKAFPLIAVVLKAESLDYFAAPMQGIKEVSFMSHPPIHIETNRLSWDLLVTM
jgi:hypothetical protein